MPNCRFGPTCNKKATCKFVHVPCKNPACIAAGKQNTHDDDKCGVLDPSRSPEEQRQAHKDFIAAKREASMAAKAAKKAKAAEAAEAKPPEVAPAASDKPPDITGAMRLAAQEKLYAQYVEAFTHDENSYKTLMEMYPLDLPAEKLAGKLVGMLGEGLEVRELYKMTVDSARRNEVMLEALDILVEHKNSAT
jgi:hypothetical protein